MKKILVFCCFILVAALCGRAQADTFVAKPGNPETVLVGSKVVTVTTDNAFECGVFEISDRKNSMLESIGPVSDRFNTTMSFEMFDGASITLSCVCADQNCEKKLAQIEVR